MTRFSILVAVDLPDGRQWLRDRNLSEREFVIVTPRAPDRARGHTADAVEYTGAGSVLSRSDRERIRAAIAPCMATAPQGEEGQR
jgi:hypothetical protein